MNFSNKTEIWISPEIGKMFREIMSNLDTSTHDIYQRGGKICVCRRVKEDIVNPNGLSTPKGTTVIHYLTVPQIKMLLADNFYFKQYDSKGNEKQGLPPNDVCVNIYQAVEFPGISVLKGITQYPILMDNGDINYKPGYDNKTGYFYEKVLPFKPLGKLTKKDAQLALEDLRDVFCDFPFISKCDCDVIIASMLSILCRPMFLGYNIPIFVCEAPVRGSGKSLLFDIVSLILNGTVMGKSPYPNKLEEIDKTICTAAKEGRSTFLFDNVTYSQRFGTPSIDALITSNGLYEFRLLTKNEIFRAEWNTVMFVNGNNILASIRPDTTRRVIPLRIEPEEAKPQKRSNFKYPKLPQHVLANRVRYLNDLMTIIGAWFQAGCPYDKEYVMGSFEKWACVIPPCIVWAGGENILDNSENLGFVDSEEDTEELELFRLLNERYSFGFRSSDIFESLQIPKSDTDREIKSKFTEIFGDMNNLTSKRIGRFLSSHKGKRLGDFKLVPYDNSELSKSCNKWKVIKTEKKTDNTKIDKKEEKMDHVQVNMNFNIKENEHDEKNNVDNKDYDHVQSIEDEDEGCPF